MDMHMYDLSLGGTSIMCIKPFIIELEFSWGWRFVWRSRGNRQPAAPPPLTGLHAHTATIVAASRCVLGAPALRPRATATRGVLARYVCV